MPDVKRSGLVLYGAAVGMVGVAFLITASFPLLYTRVPFALFYVSVAVSALYGGRRVGLLAMGLSAIASGYFLFNKSWTLSTPTEGALLVGVFIFVSFVISWLTERVKSVEVSSRAINSRLTASLEEVQFHARLLDVVEQAILATDLDGHIIYWNKFAESLYGWKQDEVMGLDIVEVVPSDTSREQALEIMAQLREGKSWSGEFLAQHRDGTTIPVRVCDSPIYDENGQLIGIVGSSEDISRRIRTDREKARLTMAIEEQRLRLDQIVANVPGVVWEATGEPGSQPQRINFISEYVERLLGYSVDEALSTPNFWQDITDENDRDRAASEAIANFEIGKGVSRFRLISKDGCVHWVEAQTVVIHDDNDHPIGMRGVTMDITDRVRADEMQARLASIVESSDDAIISKTLDGIITSWNKGATRLYQYTAEEVLGKPVSIIIPPERPLELPRILSQLKSGRRVEQFETIRVKKDGTRIDIAVSMSPIYNPNGTVIGAAAIAQDITQRKLVEVRQAELFALEQAARSQAELANRTKDEFLATLSHELRTPLTAMLGWTWMLRYRTLDDETFTRAVETIDRNVHMQAHLIDDLLDVSRIITGNLRLEVRPADLVLVVEEAINTVRAAAVAKEIDLQLDLDQSAKNVPCDPARMQQVAWNLLSNAVKFTPSRGLVRVRLKRNEKQIELNVTDNGRGINVDFLPFVFDRFRQADSSTTRTHGGLGLGLAIVRHLVELHGGTVRVESDGAEKGSSFTVMLPLVATSETPVNAA